MERRSSRVLGTDRARAAAAGRAVDRRQRDHRQGLHQPAARARAAQVRRGAPVRADARCRRAGRRRRMRGDETVTQVRARDNPLLPVWARRSLLSWLGALALLAGGDLRAGAQSGDLKALIEDLVAANRILYRQGVVDG